MTAAAAAPLPLVLLVVRVFDVDIQTARVWVMQSEAVLAAAVDRAAGVRLSGTPGGDDDFPIGGVIDAVLDEQREAKDRLQAQLAAVDVGFAVTDLVNSLAFETARSAAVWGVLLGWRLRGSMIGGPQ